MNTKTTIDIGGAKISIENAGPVDLGPAISFEAVDVLSGDEALTTSVESLVRLNMAMAMGADAEAARSSEGVAGTVGAGVMKVIRIIINAMKNAWTWVQATVKYITQRIQGKMIEGAYKRAVGKITPNAFEMAYNKVKGEKVKTLFGTYWYTKGSIACGEAAIKLDAFVASIDPMKKSSEKTAAAEKVSPELAEFIRGLGLPAEITEGKAAADYLCFGEAAPSEKMVAVSEAAAFLYLVGKAAATIGEAMAKSVVPLAKMARTITIVGTKAKLITQTAEKEVNAQKTDQAVVATEQMVSGLHQRAKDIQFVIQFTNELVSIQFKSHSFNIKLIKLVLKEENATRKEDAAAGKAAGKEADKAAAEKAAADKKAAAAAKKGGAAAATA